MTVVMVIWKVDKYDFKKVGSALRKTKRVNVSNMKLKGLGMML